MVELSFNTAVHESTKCTPDKLFWEGNKSIPYQSDGIYPLQLRMVLGRQISRSGQKPIRI